MGLNRLGDEFTGTAVLNGCWGSQGAPWTQIVGTRMALDAKLVKRICIRSSEKRVFAKYPTAFTTTQSKIWPWIPWIFGSLAVPIPEVRAKKTVGLCIPPEIPTISRWCLVQSWTLQVFGALGHFRGPYRSHMSYSPNLPQWKVVFETSLFFGNWAGAWKTMIHSSKNDNICYIPKTWKTIIHTLQKNDDLELYTKYWPWPIWLRLKITNPK